MTATPGEEEFNAFKRQMEDAARAQAQLQAASLYGRNLPPLAMPPGVPVPLAEGSPPTVANPFRFGSPESGPVARVELQAGRIAGQIEAQMARVKENRDRRERIARPGPVEMADLAREEARQGLGRALTGAVEAGLLTEERALAIIAVGGLNDRPMDPSDLQTLLLGLLAQAVDSEAISRVRADAAIGLLAPDAEGGTDPLEDLVYRALTLTPCHAPDHDQYHRDSTEPCDRQASNVVAELLDGLDVPRSALPRTPHCDRDGGRSACCRNDGRVGTWLVHGRTRDPAAD